MKIIAAITTALLLLLPARALGHWDSVFTVQAHFTAAPTMSIFQSERYPGSVDKTLIGYSITSRVMWLPSRHLSIGVMSGYSLLANEKLSPADSTNIVTPEASLTAVPIQAIISMQWRALETGIGMGPYLLTGTLRGDVTAQGTRMELGLLGFMNYKWPIAEDLYVAAEARVVYMSFRRVVTIMPSLSIRYDFFTY